MEYHRFRLLVYLAAVPAGLALLQRGIGGRTGMRAATAVATTGVAALALLAPYDTRGPGPLPLPGPVPAPGTSRILVVASPGAQAGAWHALQLLVPPAMGVEGAKGLFVEATPFARPVFEAERAASGPGTSPRWWAIRTSPDALGEPDALARRLAGLGVGAVVAREPVSPGIRALAEAGAIPLGNAYRLFRIPPYPARGDAGWIALPPLADSPIPARGTGVSRIRRSPAGDSITVSFDAGGGHAVLLTFAHSDWRVESGDGEIGRVPLAPESGIDAPLLEVRGRGPVTVHHGPRVEEWAGLAVGLAAAGGALLAGSVGRRKRRPA
jgi:hypothetical protein